MAKLGVQGDSAGGATTSPQSFVKINGKEVLVSGTSVANHGDSPHNNAKINKGNFFFKINGDAVLVDGDTATCGHSLVASGFVNVG